MTIYLVQCVASADGGQIWQELDVREPIDTGDTEPIEWANDVAIDVAHQTGAVPGARVRVLMWSGDVDDPHRDNVSHIGEYLVPEEG